jgi:hypothetical protein
LAVKSQKNRKAIRSPAKKPAKRTGTALGAFVPYKVELGTAQNARSPIKHFIYVYRNGEFYVIELHRPTSRVGLYGQHWTITKVKFGEAITKYTIGLAGGRITRYTILTKMARKLEKHIAVYEAQQEEIEKTVIEQKKNRNDHYVSQVLLRRFTTDNGRLQKYTLKHGKWSQSAPRSIFSEIGYNQLLAFGKFNADLDDRLKELEDTLPVTLAALDNAANAKQTTLDPMT